MNIFKGEKNFVAEKDLLKTKTKFDLRKQKETHHLFTKCPLEPILTTYRKTSQKCQVQRCRRSGTEGILVQVVF